MQTCNNEYKAAKLIRLSVLALAGYLVVAVDGRGSTNRGLAFEAPLQYRMVGVVLYSWDTLSSIINVLVADSAGVVAIVRGWDGFR